MPPPPNQPEREWGIQDILGFFLNHWLSFFVCLGLGLGGGMFMQRTMPVTYESKGRFIVNELPVSLEPKAMDAETERQLVQTFILSIPSKEMLAAIMARTKAPSGSISFVDVDPAISLKKVNPAANIKVSGEKNSRLGLISVESNSPEFAAKVANAILAELDLRNYVAGQLKTIQLSLKLAKTRADGVLDQYISLSADRIKLEQQNQALDEYLKQGLPVESFPAFAFEPTLNNLKTQLMLVESEYKSVAGLSTRGMRLEGKRAELQTVRKQISQQSESLTNALRSQLQIVRTRSTDLQNELNATQKQISEIEDHGARLLKSMGDPSLIQQTWAAEGYPRQNSGNIIVVVEFASPEKKPIKPKLWINLALGLFLGGGLGLATAALRTLLDNRLRTAELTERRTGLPCLAMLPPLDPVEKKENIFDRPRSPIGLGYLRTHLLRTTMENTSRRIIGFSPSRQKGDAARLAATLAILLAQSERRTLVIDLCRKPPRVARILRVEKADGLSQWLGSDAPLRDCIGYTAIKELGVLGFGKITRDLDDMLGRRPLSMELPTLLDEWDFILVVSPAIRFDWSMMLTLPEESPLVITADYHRARAGDVKATVNRAQNSNWPIEGVVLLDCPRRVSGSRSL